MEELLPVLLITLSAVFRYCKSQVITNFITICEPLYFRWNQSCGDLSDKSDDGIAIFITFNNISHAMMAEKPAKKFAACSEFLLCFIYFLISMLIVVALSLLVTLLCNTILGMWWFCLKNRWKVQQNWHGSYEYMKIMYVNYGEKN